MFVDVGKSEVSPSFESLLQLLLARNEYLAYVPDTDQTKKMLDVLSLRYPLLQVRLPFLFFYVSKKIYSCHLIERLRTMPDELLPVADYLNCFINLLWADTFLD